MALLLRFSAFPFVAIVAMTVMLSCAGCSERFTDPSTSTAPIASAVAAETRPETDAGKGKGYTFQIVYPALAPDWKPLDEAIRHFAAAQKKEFLGESSASDRDSGVDYTLDLNFAVARRTADFVSVMASGSSFIGGAHGMPILASFNLDLATGKLTPLPELFADAQAGLNALSAECRRQLEGRYEAKVRESPGAMTPAQQASDIQFMKRWIEKGTAPDAANFGVFLIDGLDTRAIGVTVIFPPYKVASYADGPQQVEVPAKVFYDLLKPEYKDAFAIDTEAAKLGAGVR
ncbi:MAG TPA: DUF3298 domain-containing protein [Rudaea sp.]|nr:DUF3298 domain-containing protein [Rudaea sp.]